MLFRSIAPLSVGYFHQSAVGYIFPVLFGFSSFAVFLSSYFSSRPSSLNAVLNVSRLRLCALKLFTPYAVLVSLLLSFLIQLQFSASSLDQESPRLLGVLIRGMNYDGERRRLVTVGDWLPQGSHLPHPAHSAELQQICRDLFKLFPSEVPLNELP